jgi:PAS domain S-box-containing protein
MPSPLRVLCVDDEPGLLGIAKLYLEREGVFSVDTLTSARPALLQVKTENYDAIISDYQMPEMDGITFLKELKASGNTTPFIIFTGKGREEVVIEALNEGADFYLQKGGEPKSQFAELSNKIRYAVAKRQVEEEIRTAQETYRNIFLNSQIGLFRTDINTGLILDANDTVARFIGYPDRASLLAIPFNIAERYADPGDRERMISLLQADGEFLNYEARFKKNDCSVIWMRFSGRLVKEKGWIEGVSEDITGQKRIEEALLKKSEELHAANEELTASEVELRQNIDDLGRSERELRVSEEKYRNTIEKIHAAVVVHNPDTSIRMVNPSAIELLGLTHDEATGKTPPDPSWRLSDEDGNRLTLADYPVNQVLATQKPLRNMVASIFRPRGRDTAWVLINADPEHDERGRITSVLVTFTDITERRKAEQALKENEEKYRELIENANSIILKWDKTGKITFFNEFAQRFFGYTRDEIIGKSVMETIVPATESGSDRDLSLMIDDIIRHPEDHIFNENENVTKDGRRVWIKWQNKPLLDDDGQFAGLFSIGTDITARRNAEDVLKHQSTALLILTEVISAANKADDLPKLISNLLEESLRLLDFDAGGIYLVDYSSRNASVVQSKNLPAELLAEIQTVSIDEKPYDTLFIKNEPIITDYYARIAPERSKKYGFHSMASIPLLSKGVSIGALNIASSRRYVITGEEKQTLISIGKELGSTIERMAAEEGIKSASKNLETLFNSIDEMVFVLDMQGDILTVNNAVLKRLAYTPEELAGTNVLQLHVPERRDEALLIVQAMIAGTIDSCPVPVLSKDGTRIEVETTVTRGWWNNREVLIGVSRDVTDRRLAEEALRESETKLQLALSGSETGMWELDIPTMTGAIDDRAADILGYQKKDIGSRNTDWDALSHPEDVPLIRQRLADYLEGRTTAFKSEHRMLHASGQWIWVIGRGKITHRYPDGLPLRISGTLHDITERKRAEEALRESELLLREIFDNANDGVFLLERNPDGPGKYLHVNDKAVRMLGYSKEEFMKMSPRDIVPEDIQKNTMPKIIKKLLKDGHATFESQHRRKDGSLYPIEVSVHTFRYKEKDVDLSIIRDITERRQAEEALRESEEKYRALFAAESDGIIVVDRQTGVIIDCNDALPRMYGYRKEEMIGKHTTATSAEPDATEEAIRAGTSHIPVRNHKRKDGTVFPVEITSNIISLHGRDIIIAAVRDITERVRVEEALRKANKKLNLLSGITRHDINNQLTLLQGYLSIIEKNPADPSLNEYFQKVNSSAERISSLIRFSREYEEIGINAPFWQDCRNIVDAESKEAPLGKVRVINDLPPGTEVFADPLITNVFYNLVDNAVQYGGKITTIRFSLEEQDNEHVLICEDDGAGIPVEEKERIFERGFGRNTGLGLALSREILDITGLTITETGVPGEGARFEIVVPKGMYRKSIPAL